MLWCTSSVLKLELTLFYRVFWSSGHEDVHWTSVRRPFWTRGRPKWTSNGRPLDWQNATKHVRPDMDVRGRPNWTLFELSIKNEDV